MAGSSSRNELAVLDHRWVDVPDREAAQRVPIRVPAVLVSTALGRVRATVTDISMTGCRIDTAARCYVGDRFVLKFEATGPKSVRVVWCEGRQVGLEFAVALGWSIVSEIAFGGPAI